MAGTISITTTTTTTANNTLYRVTIDIQKIQSNVYKIEGGRLTELAVYNWLRSVGFRPEPSGKTWIADREALSRLDPSEIVHSERLWNEPIHS